MKLIDIMPLSSQPDGEFEPYILITIADGRWHEVRGKLSLFEGGWRPSGVGDLWVRTNPPRPEMNMPANVHVAHKKHISAKSKQVSWSAGEGHRHDRMTFDQSFSPIEKAKQVARVALKLPADFPLESTQTTSTLLLLLEGEHSPPEKHTFLLVAQ